MRQVRSKGRSNGVKSGAGFATAVAVLAMGVATPARVEDPLDAEFRTKVRPVLAKHCAGCHSGRQAAAGLDLSTAWTAKSALAERAKWERVVFNVKSATMPPPPSEIKSTDRDVVVGWAERVLSSDCNLADAGKVTIRRLNRSEYRNSLRDLLGIETDLTTDFPSDDVGSGFDNIGDVLSLSPLYVEKLVSAAERAATLAVRIPGPVSVPVEVHKMALTQGVAATGEDVLAFTSAGRATVALAHLQPGEYTAKIDAYAQQAGPEPAKMRVAFRDKLLDDVVVRNGPDKPTTYQIPFTLTADDRDATFWITFPNDYYDPKNPELDQRDRNLFVSKIVFEKAAEPLRLPNGPIVRKPNGPGDRETPARDLKAFMRRAYRRDVTSDEVSRLMSVFDASVKKGKVYESAIRDCVTAVLCSPHFLFRKEEAPVVTGEAVAPFEAASRLSFFLWSSAPDDRLLDLAAQGKLQDPKTVAEQVDRMLLSSKSQSLAEDFAMQWLQLRKLEGISPDPRLFPGFSPELREDMAEEAKAFFLDALANDASVLVFLDSDYGFLNERLAKVYGVSGISGAKFRKVKWTDPARGGLTGMAGVLATTSNPNRTSPVKRGKWVLEQILGTPPPPPPPGAGSLPEDVVLKPTMTMKERLEAHRKKPDCATCHRAMDAMGFSLENFDPIGQWRTKDGDFDIDPVTVLPDGSKLDGPRSLRKHLLSRKKDFVRSLAERLLTFATGRAMRPEDGCHLDTIVKAAEKDGYKFRSLIKAVVASDPFSKKSK